jgi:hypothetical protein
MTTTETTLEAPFETPFETRGQADPETLRREYAQLLGVEEPISEAVLWAMAEDPSYARRLFACRSAPQVMTLMLQNPPAPARAQSAAELIATASTALARWAGAGFAVLAEDEIERRLDACLACPNLSAPRSVLQKLAGLAAADGRVCGLCGCNVARKARMSTERCPGAAPDDASVNRWGQPLPAAALA